MQNRPLRSWEQGAHLHVLDWTHATARQRLQAAGAVQVKAAAKAFSKADPDTSRPPALPSLQAAIASELRQLYAVGHATVRSELQHQSTGESLAIGLSAAPAPPNLRKASKATKRCGTCKMFDSGVCWGYGNYPVKPGQVCDSYAPEDKPKALALDSAARDPGSLRTRAGLISADVAHAIWQAVHRARLHGIADPRAQRRAGREAGSAALAQGASHHAGGAINAGRHAAAAQAKVAGARYTSVLDKNTCGACAEADDGVLRALDDPALVHPPNPACLGGDRCRCLLVYQLLSETPPRSLLPPDDFPREPRQPDRPSGVSAMPVAAVGVGGS